MRSDRHPEKDGTLQVHVLLQHRLRQGHQLHQVRVTTHRTDSRGLKLEATGVHHGATTAKFIHGSMCHFIQEKPTHYFIKIVSYLFFFLNKGHLVLWNM